MNFRLNNIIPQHKNNKGTLYKNAGANASNIIKPDNIGNGRAFSQPVGSISSDTAAVQPAGFNTLNGDVFQPALNDEKTTKTGKKTKNTAKKVISNSSNAAKGAATADAQKAATNFEKGVKKFLSDGGEVIDNIKLEKGRALNADGSGFSGIMKTVNNKGEKITIKYVDGYIEETRINGDLFKSFEQPSDFWGNPIDNSVLIKENMAFDPAKSFLIFHDNGKLAEYRAKNKEIYFSPEGKKTAEAKFNAQGKFEVFIQYDDKGNKIFTPSPWQTNDYDNELNMEIDELLHGDYICW